MLKNLLLVCGCLLAASPCMVAVLNFRRRTAAKRRALTNLLSDPNILARYKDRFPARKYLGGAESIARDYFATYFNRSEYATALAFHLLTDAIALVFMLTRIGFAPFFLEDATIKFITGAASSRAALWALIGSYLWNCYDLMQQASNFNLRPSVLTRMWLKLWVAAAVAAMLSDGITSGLQPVVGFAIGLISIPALFAAVADKASKSLSIKTTDGETTTPLKVLQGATPDVIDTFCDIDITSTEHLAYCDPINVMMSTSLPWLVTIDLIDQALLFNYVGSDMAKVRSSGYRGSIEVATIGVNLKGTPAQIASGAASVTNFAAKMGWPEPQVLDLVQTLYFDSQVNLIWDLFGGSFRQHVSGDVPVGDLKTPDITQPPLTPPPPPTSPPVNARSGNGQSIPI